MEIKFRSTYKVVKYNLSFYRADELLYWAHIYLEQIPKNVKLILSKGSSGCSIASAIMLVGVERDLRNIYIANKKEKSHRDDYSDFNSAYYGLLLKGTNPLGNNYKNCVIVDDFMDTGDTIINLVEEAEDNNLNVKRIIVYSISYRAMKKLKKHFGDNIEKKIVLLEKILCPKNKP